MEADSKKIKEDYKKAYCYRPELEPTFYSDISTFRVTLYNLNYERMVEEKQDIDIEKTGHSEEKQDINTEKAGHSEENRSINEVIDSLNLGKTTKTKMKMLYSNIGENVIFSRPEVMEIVGITASPASELIRKMKQYGLIEKVQGRGKGKYRFIH